MANQFNVNATVTQWEGVIYELKEHLKSTSSPWTVPQSSNGTLSASDVIASPADLATQNHWIRIAEPAGGQGREFTFQRGNFDTVWRVKMSVAGGGGFTTGAGNLQTPTTADPANEIVLFGGGTDASPTYDTIFAGVATSAILQIMAGDAAVRTTFPWYLVVYTSGNRSQLFMALDTLDTASAPSDSDASIAWAKYDNDEAMDRGILASSGNATANAAVIGPIRGKAVGEYMRMRPWLFTAGTSPLRLVVPGGFNSNPNNSEDQALLMPVGIASSEYTPNAFKGYSELFLWLAQSRSHGDVFTFSGTKSHALFGDVIVPWDGTSNPTT